MPPCCEWRRSSPYGLSGSGSVRACSKLAGTHYISITRRRMRDAPLGVDIPLSLSGRFLRVSPDSHDTVVRRVRPHRGCRRCVANHLSEASAGHVDVQPINTCRLTGGIPATAPDRTLSPFTSWTTRKDRCLAKARPPQSVVAGARRERSGRLDSNTAAGCWARRPSGDRGEPPRSS